MIHHVIQMGGMTRGLFAEFLNNTALIYDGARAHGRAADPTDDIHVESCRTSHQLS